MSDHYLVEAKKIWEKEDDGNGKGKYEGDGWRRNEQSLIKDDVWGLRERYVEQESYDWVGEGRGMRE